MLYSIFFSSLLSAPLLFHSHSSPSVLWIFFPQFLSSLYPPYCPSSPSILGFPPPPSLSLILVISSSVLSMRSLSSRSPMSSSPQLSPLGGSMGGSVIAHGLRSFHRGSAFLPAFVIEGCNAQLDEIGFDFVRKCIRFIEDEGMREQGIYRNCGVNSKVKKMMGVGLERRKANEGKSWIDESEWETKTVSSAFKTYLRNLPEPLMTFDLHSYFISAAKMDDRKERVEHIHYYVYKLPREHKEMLEMVITHLRRVADSSGENLMTVGNLGVCFGPTLLRPREETVAAIMDIKFCNVVVEVLIAHAKEIFENPPPTSIGSMKNENVKEMNEGRGEEKKEEMREEKKEDKEGIGRREDAIIVAERAERLKDKPRSFPTMNSAEREDRRQIKRSAHVDGERPRRANHGSSVEETRVREEEEEVNQRENNLAGVYTSPASTSSNEANRRSPRCLPSSSIASPSRSLHQRPSLPPPIRHSHSSPGGKGRGNTLHSTAPSNQPIYAFVKPSTSNAPSAPCVRVRTLYTCTPDHESELSFEAGQIITNVLESAEDGWLTGTLNGKTGLIPANYVEYL